MCDDPAHRDLEGVIALLRMDIQTLEEALGSRRLKALLDELDAGAPVETGGNG